MRQHAGHILILAAFAAFCAALWFGPTASLPAPDIAAGFALMLCVTAYCAYLAHQLNDSGDDGPNDGPNGGPNNGPKYA